MEEEKEPKESAAAQPSGEESVKSKSLFMRQTEQPPEALALHVTQYRQQILDTINANEVTIIIGTAFRYPSRHLAISPPTSSSLLFILIRMNIYLFPSFCMTVKSNSLLKFFY